MTVTPEEARTLLEGAQSAGSVDWRVEYRWDEDREWMGYDVLGPEGQPPARHEEIAALMAAAPALARTVAEMGDLLAKAWDDGRAAALMLGEAVTDNPYRRTP